MKKLSLTALLFTVVLLFVGMPALLQGQTADPCHSDSLPSNDPQYPENQLILICVPPNWGGDLVVYAHGYVPPQEPLALPLEELTLPDQTFVPTGFLAQGFAFATSSYHKKGVATEQGVQDLLDLVKHFESTVDSGSLKRVFIAGASEGGLIAIQLLEQHPDRFDAGLALCAPAGGAPRQIKYAEDFRVVFDYFFPDVFPFGAFNVPADAFSTWDAYMQAIIASMTSDPLKSLQLFSVTRAALDPADPRTAVASAIGVLSYSIFGTNDLMVTTGGIPYDNRFTLYIGLTNNLALNAGVERIRGDQEAERYARAFYQTSGDLTRPLVALHNTLDPIVPFEHELIYTALVKLRHKSRFFNLLPVRRYGHCNFTSDEIFNAFGLMLKQAARQTQR